MTPPPHSTDEEYQNAGRALHTYGRAIAELTRQSDHLSYELVDQVLLLRDSAYEAVYALSWIWFVAIIYAIGNASLQILNGLTQWIPGALKRSLFNGVRQLEWLWLWLPKSVRVFIKTVLNSGRWLPGVHPVQRLIAHLALLKQVDELDRCLYAHADSINQQAAPIPPIVWAELRYAPEHDAFGFLTVPELVPLRDRLDVIWEFLSIVFLTAAFAILVNISTRLFSDGPDAKGIQEIILPSLLTLLAGSGLTRTGREALGRIFDAFNAPKHWRDEFIFATIFVLFLLICYTWQHLPEGSLKQTLQGHQSMCFVQAAPATQPAEQPWLKTLQRWIKSQPSDPEPCVPQLAKAEAAYSLAIKLDADNTEAYYGLGRVYEALQQTDPAIAQYQLAVKGELRGMSYKAYDRLSRLFILKSKKDSKDDGYVKAISISKGGLDRLLSMPSKDRQMISDTDFRDIEYALYKNLGWAYLVGQENLGEAKSYLDQAIRLIDDRAPAYCLLAQVYEKQNDLSLAKSTWEQCNQFAIGTDQSSFGNGIDREEESWFNQSRERWKQLSYDQLVTTAQRQLDSNRLEDAWKTLQQAIGLLKGRAPAYCIMAQVDEKRHQLPMAKTHWELCEQYARLNTSDRDIWLQMARTRLNFLTTLQGKLQ